MKNSLSLYCLVAVFALFLSSCATTDESEMTELNEISQDEMQLMDRTPQVLLPDLKVTLVTSDLPLGCDSGPLAGNAVCFGPGSTDVILNAKIENCSARNITTPFIVEFDIISQGPINVIVPSLGGNSSTVEEVSFSVPCASGTPPFQQIQEQILVTADVTNVITESNEANNFRRYFFCRAE